MTAELTTPNASLPLLDAGQAQKELTHNEALVLVDALLCGKVEGVNANTPPAQPPHGQLWIIGPSPTGAWTGAAGQLALATAGGWRLFNLPVDSVLRRSAGGLVRRTAQGWATMASPAAPAGGATVDAEARAAIAALHGWMRTAGWLESAST